MQLVFVQALKRKPADFLPLRIIEDGRVRLIIPPDIDRKATIKARVALLRPDPQHSIGSQHSAQRTRLIPHFRDKPPAAQIDRLARQVLDIHVLSLFVPIHDADAEASARCGRRLGSGIGGEGCRGGRCCGGCYCHRPGR